MIVIPEQTVTWFGLSDSFWGSLSGAVITGIIAILVFIIGSRIERKRKENLIKNYQETVKEVHSNTIEDFKMFLEASKPKKELPEDYQDKILYLLTNGRILNHLDVNEMLKESKKAIHVMEYALIFQEAAQLISSKHHGRYGNIFFKFGSKDSEKTAPETLEYYINNLETIIEKIK